MTLETTNVDFEYGTITYRRGVDAVPPSTVVNGNVTVHNEGSEGSPSRFKVSFWVGADQSLDGTEFRNFFNIDVVLTGKDKDTPYSEIEAEAARHVAPMLRAMADGVAAQVAEYDAELAKPGSQGSDASA